MLLWWRMLLRLRRPRTEPDVNIFAILRIALNALRVNKLRSTLTMLGIIIGVAAVIAMVSIGGGAREQVVARIRSLGANLIVIVPGNIRAGGLNLGAGAASNCLLRPDESAKLSLRDSRDVPC